MNSVLGIAARTLPIVLGTRAKQRLTILIFHRVLPSFDPMRPDEPTVDQFDWQMRTLRQHFSPLGLVDALQRMEAGTLPERAVCVTFDDGYADNEECALPILRKYAVPASVFVSTAFINGGRMWNDSVREALRIYDGDSLNLNDLGLESYATASYAERLLSAESIISSIKRREPEIRGSIVEAIEQRVEGLPNDLMLTTEQLRALAEGGISIGAHTVNHPILASVPDESAQREISQSKEVLEALVQKPVELFAYPNGGPNTDYRREHRNMVEQLGFKAAVSTHWGAASGQSDFYQLPRFTPWDRSPARFALRLLANYRRLDPLIGAGF